MTNFMEGVAGIAGRVAVACAGLFASPGGMVPNDMQLEITLLADGVLGSLSATAVT